MEFIVQAYDDQGDPVCYHRGIGAPTRFGALLRAMRAQYPAAVRVVIDVALDNS